MRWSFIIPIRVKRDELISTRNERYFQGRCIPWKVPKDIREIRVSPQEGREYFPLAQARFNRALDFVFT